MQFKLFRKRDKHALEREARELLVSGLFDAKWYVAAYPDVAMSDMDPLWHYVLHGEREGRQPNALFDVQWYRQIYQDVADKDISPSRHFLEFGAIEGRNPHPLFDTRFYLSNNPDCAAQHQSPLVHFLRRWSSDNFAGSWRLAETTTSDDRSLDPHPLFDTSWYVRSYGGKIQSGVPPFVDFLDKGALLGRDPHPLIDSRWYRRAYPERPRDVPVLTDYLASDSYVVRQSCALFDRRWYVESYGREIDPSVDPLVDYITLGRQVGRLPHPLFSSDWYASQNPEAKEYRGGPLCHFIEIGASAGLNPHPLFDTRFYVETDRAAGTDPLGPLAHFLLAPADRFPRPHPLFDPRWYTACNPDVVERGINAFVHFLGYGIWSNRDPSPLFETDWYIQNYPEARRHFEHPLVHYLEKGSASGFWPASFFDPAFYSDAYPDCGSMEPLIHFARYGLQQGHAPNAWFGHDWGRVPEPNVYGSHEERLSNFVRDIGLTSRLVLACEAVKHDPVAYSYYFSCLTSNNKRWPVRSDRPRDRPIVSVILPVYNGIHFTIACIESIGRFLPEVSFELIVADNVSNDETQKILNARKDIRYIRNPQNVGFLRSCNRAARFARGDFIFLLNNDTIVVPGWLDELYLTFSSFENVGLVGSKLIYPDGRLQEAGGIIWQDGSAWNYGKFQNPDLPEFNYVRETDYCSGAAIMVPKRLWDELGGFDEMYVPSYCEDSDLALRIRALGYSVLYNPLSVVAHFEGMTQGRDTSSGIKAYQVSNTQKLLDRWRSYLQTLQPNGEQIDMAKDRGVEKRALFLDNCTPATREDAGSVTAFNLMLLLRSRGYQVTFIPQDNYLYVGEDTKLLQRNGIECLYGHFTTSVQAHLEQHGSRYDVIVMMRPDSYSRHIAAIQKFSPSAKLVYHTCDLHYLRFQREYELTGNRQRLDMAENIKKIEFDALRTADASIVHSTVEAEIIGTDLPNVRGVHVFGWAVPVAPARSSFAERQGAVFVGGYNHGPNVDAVLYFSNEILPLIWRRVPEFTFHIVGSKVPEEISRLASDRIKVHGFLDDLDPLFQQCRLAVAPLRFGAGIKGKIATAMSVGLPNVVTSVGAEGMGLADGVNCLVADTPAAFADAVCLLNEDEALWNKLSRASEEFVEENYGPTAAGRIFDEILEYLGESVPPLVPPPALISPAGSRGVAAWPGKLLPMASFTSELQFQRFARSKVFRAAERRDSVARLKLGDFPERGFPAYSTLNDRMVTLRVTDGEAVFNHGSMRQELCCPISGLNNADRLLATIAKQAVGPRLSFKEVSGRIESDPLKAWLQEQGARYNGRARSGMILDDDVSPVTETRSSQIKSRLVSGGAVYIAQTDARTAFNSRNAMLKAGFSRAAVEYYHSPDFGHLGDDLFVVVAYH